MTNKARSIAVIQTFLRLAAIGLIPLFVGTGLSEAKPKKPLSQTPSPGAPPTGAGAASRLNVAGLNVMLSCQIANWKVIVITNSTGAAIAAGTKISYDAIRSGGNEHYGETLNGPLLPPGASIQRGGSESSSCTAWFRKPMLLSPQ